MYFIFVLLHMKTLGEWNLNMSSLFSTTKCFPHRAKRRMYKLNILRILQNNQPPNESWLRLALNGRTNRDFDIPQVVESGHLLPSHLRRLLNKVNRCPARYSPRATTTNRPANRAPNKPAWLGPN